VNFGTEALATADHFCAILRDAAALERLADHIAGDVLKEHDRYVALWQQSSMK
jgi:hypothetical protein